MKSKLCLLCSCNFILLYLIFWSEAVAKKESLEKILCNYCNFHVSESLAVKQFVWNKSTFILPPATVPVGKGQQNSGRSNEEFFLL